MSSSEATVRQKAFVKNLFNVKNPKTFGNATQSARLAAYSGDENSLAVTGSRLLRNVKVQRLVKKHMAKILTGNEVLEKLSTIANTEVEDVKSSDVIKTLELLAKHHKLLTDKVESESTVTLNAHDLPALYMKEAANKGLILTREEAQARIDAQLNPQSEVNQQDTETDSVN